MRIIGITILAVLFFLLNSCVVSRSTYGDFERTDCKTETFVKDKEIYLFWDKLPLQQITIPDTINNYQKVVKRNVFDGLVYYGTMGIISHYTVTYKIKICPKEKAQ